MPMSSTRVWVTTTSGTKVRGAGRANANGSITSEFRVAPLKITAFVLAESSLATRDEAIPNGTITIRNATYSGMTASKEVISSPTP